MNFKSVFGSVLLACCVSVGVQAIEKNDSAQEARQKAISVQKQLDDLVNVGGKYAYKQLTDSKYFAPFAVGVNAAKQVVVLRVPDSEIKASFSDKIAKLREILKETAKKNKITSAALFVQAQVPHQGVDVDGVAIEMEHRLGLSILRFSPYDIDLKSKKLQFRKPVDKLKPLVFFKGMAK